MRSDGAGVLATRHACARRRSFGPTAECHRERRFEAVSIARPRSDPTPFGGLFLHHAVASGAGFVTTERNATGFTALFSLWAARDCNLKTESTFLDSAATLSCCFESLLRELSIRESLTRMSSSFSSLLLALLFLAICEFSRETNVAGKRSLLSPLPHPRRNPEPRNHVGFWPTRHKKSLESRRLWRRIVPAEQGRAVTGSPDVACRRLCSTPRPRTKRDADPGCERISFPFVATGPRAQAIPQTRRGKCGAGPRYLENAIATLQGNPR
jgi:hypothetical protein